MSNDDCTVTPAGIQVHYCVGNARRSVWVNLSQVQAIAWTAGKVKEKGDIPSPECDPIPRTNGPVGCTDDLTDGPLCRYDGKDWVCGEA